MERYDLAKYKTLATGIKVRRIFFFSILSFAFIVSSTVLASDIYSFTSIKKQQQFYSLINQLRCLVCQNETLADSNASLALDLRNQVYQMVLQGKSTKAIKAYLVKRYGDFILFKPPVQKRTYLLWFGPIIMFTLGIVILLVVIYQYKTKYESEKNLPSINSHSFKE